jgi:phasin
MEMLMATETKARAAKPQAVESEKIAREAKAAAKDVFSFPAFEVPELFRSFTEQGLNQTRETYARMKSATEEATDMLEQSMESARETIRDAQFKALDLAKSTTDATFDFYRQLLTTNSVGDALQLQTTFARERFEALVDYSKDVQATLTKVGSDASKPAKAIFDKTLAFSKAA